MAREKETIEQFAARSYTIFDFKGAITLVWKTDELKKMTASRKNKPEKWDEATTKRYVGILTNEQI